MTDTRVPPEGSATGTATTALDYGQGYYEGYLGPPYTYEEPHWQRFFGGIAQRLVQLVGPRTAYDAGCAKGFLVRALRENGVDARGGDISAHAIEGAPPGLAEHLEVKDLTEPLEGRYDLVTCIEVLEHMDPADALLAIHNLCAVSDVVLMSSTPEHHADPTHVNVRPTGDWVRDFAREGMFRRVDLDASFVSPWAVIFERARPTAADLAGRYESALVPLTREVVAKRQALLEAQRALDEQSGPAFLARDGALAELTASRAEIDGLRVEIDGLQTQMEPLHTEISRLRSQLDASQAADLQAERMTRLAMADEIIGLRAELAQLQVQAETMVTAAGRDAERLRAVVAGLQAELDGGGGAGVDAAVAAKEAEFRASASWRVGRAVLLPVRGLKPALRRVRRLIRG